MLRVRVNMVRRIFKWFSSEGGNMGWRQLPCVGALFSPKSIINISFISLSHYCFFLHCLFSKSCWLINPLGLLLVCFTLSFITVGMLRCFTLLTSGTFVLFCFLFFTTLPPKLGVGGGWRMGSLCSRKYVLEVETWNPGRDPWKRLGLGWWVWKIMRW